MSVSVLPPAATPAGWFGCFSTPLSNVAQPIALFVPCGVDTVESCCGLGDECLSNSLCKNNNNPQAGVQQYYTSYCTDPTYSESECNQNCPYEPALWCGTGSEQLWQCTNTTACNLTATASPSTLFFAPAPTNLLNGTVIPKVEPSSVQPQFIPTVWNAPRAPAPTVTTTSSISTSAVTTTSGGGTTLSSTATTTNSPDNNGIQSDSPNATKIAVGVAVPVGVIVIAAAIIFVFWRKRRNARRADESSRGVYQFSKPEVSKTDGTYYDPKSTGGSPPVQELYHGDRITELPTQSNPTELPGAHVPS